MHPPDPPASADPRHRLERLEEHLAHVERQYEQLNAVVIEQARVITRLQTAVRRLGESMEQREIERILSTNPKPPHSA